VRPGRSHVRKPALALPGPLVPAPH